MKRSDRMDFLRGTAIVVMIFTHCTACYLSNKTAYALWNLSHFVVPIFLFVSSYLFFQKYKNGKEIGVFEYIKRRIPRLITPYYIFLAVFILLALFLEPKKLTPSFFLGALTITGGIDINWLVLLFVYLSVLLPIFVYMQNHKKTWFFIYFIISLLTSLVLLVYVLPTSYKLYMWIPWSLIIYFSLFLQINEDKPQYMLYGITGCAILFLITRFIRISTHQSLIFYTNKYPPNLHYLSYGMIWTSILFSLAPYVSGSSLIMKPMRFISKNSYSLFFIHYIVIYLIRKLYAYTTIYWFIFFVVVCLFSVIIQYIFNFLTLLVQKHP